MTTYTINNVCSVDNCHSKTTDKLTFFRFPKEPQKVYSWKMALGFVDDHQYASLTPEQAHAKLKVCALHFEDDSFLDTVRKRLNAYAIPQPCPKPFEIVTVKMEEDGKKHVAVQTYTVIVPNHFHRDAGCQTTTKLLAWTPREQRLKEKIKVLQKAMKKQEKKAKEEAEKALTIDRILEFFKETYSEEAFKFLKNQLSMLRKMPKGTRYSREFKQFALGVLFLGPKVYEKVSAICRMPSKSTLERVTRNWIINPGFNKFIFEVVQSRAKLLADTEKDCLVCLDCIQIKPHVYYDISKDKTVGFQTLPEGSSQVACNALILVAQGLASNWRQPIAYFFYKDTPKPSEIKNVLYESVRKLRTAGLNVLGAVSDHRHCFFKLAKNLLEISAKKPKFYVDDQPLVYFFDVGVLLKATRNTFLTHKFQFGEGLTADKSYLVTMLKVDKGKQYRIASELTDAHLFPNILQKKQLKLAQEVFSHSVAKAMHAYTEFKCLPQEALATAQFVGKMNDLFDLLHSQSYTAASEQLKLLSEMQLLFETMHVYSAKGNRITLHLRFLFGWQLNLQSILVLWEHMKARGHKELITKHLHCNQNLIEPLRKSTLSPTAIRFSRLFKKLFSLKNMERGNTAGPTEEDITKLLMNLPSNEFSKDVYNQTAKKWHPIKVFTNDYSHIRTTEGNACLDIAKYITKKCLVQHSCDVCLNYWQHLNSFTNEASLICKIEAGMSEDIKESPTTNAVCNDENVPYKQEVDDTKDEDMEIGEASICNLEPNVMTPKDVLEYILKLEHKFIDTFHDVAGKEEMGRHLLKSFEEIEFFSHPCQTFPKSYFLSLYTRVRIFYTLKFINRNVKVGSSDKEIGKLSILMNL